MFPTTVHAYSVEPARIEDAGELRSLWHRYDPPEAADALDLWLERAPAAVRVIRDRSAALVGCSIIAEWCDVPHSLERDDPVMGAWARHAALHPLPNGQRTLVHRRTLARDTGEGPSGAQAAAWLDVKRHYFQMRPQLGRIYNGIADPTPFADALAVLGFQFSRNPSPSAMAPSPLPRWTSGPRPSTAGCPASPPPSSESPTAGSSTPRTAPSISESNEFSSRPSSSACSQHCPNVRAAP